jgi:hypothetical protein
MLKPGNTLINHELTGYRNIAEPVKNFFGNIRMNCKLVEPWRFIMLSKPFRAPAKPGLFHFLCYKSAGDFNRSLNHQKEQIFNRIRGSGE